jgi:hypothetical protein
MSRRWFGLRHSVLKWQYQALLYILRYWYRCYHFGPQLKRGSSYQTTALVSSVTVTSRSASFGSFLSVTSEPIRAIRVTPGILVAASTNFSTRRLDMHAYRVVYNSWSSLFFDKSDGLFEFGPLKWIRNLDNFWRSYSPDFR